VEDDQQRDRQARQGTVDQPHHHQSGNYAWRGLAAGELRAGGGDDGPHDALGEQQAGAGAAGRPDGQREDGLVADEVDGGASLGGVGLGARDEPAQRRCDAAETAERRGEHGDEQDADEDREVGMCRRCRRSIGGLAAPATSAAVTSCALESPNT
jgi:hypothetical protein